MERHDALGRKNKALRALMGLFVLTALVLGVVSPASAITNPDSTPTIGRIKAYRNLLATNDMLLVIEANIPYSTNTTPNETVSQAFIWRLFNAAGTVELGTAIGYAYTNKGYGYNVYAMYWSNTTAPAWGVAYPLHLEGNPGLFASPPVYNYQVSTADYSGNTTTSLVQAELKKDIIDIATDLNNQWNLGLDHSLVISAEGGQYLSLYGEDFFRGAVYGIQALAPTLFRYAVGSANVTDRTWTLTYATSVETQYVGTWVDTAKAAGNAFFGTDYDLMTIVLVLAICAGLFVAQIMVGGDFWDGLGDSTMWLIVAARLGLYAFGFLGLLAAITVIFLGIWVRSIVT